MPMHPLRLAGFSTLVIALSLAGACTGGPSQVAEPTPTVEPSPTPELVVEAQPIAQEDAEGQEEPVVAVAGAQGMGGIENGVMLATALLDRKIDNLAGDGFGEVDDLLVDLATGNVLYAEVKHGGFLDIGESQVMVPLAALQWNAADEEFVITTSGSELFDAWPDLDEGWPDAIDPAWDDEVIKFWDNAGINTPWAVAPAPSQVAWASALLDGELSLLDDGSVAIQDLMVDLSQSQVTYILLDENEGLFDDSNWHALPYRALVGVALTEDTWVFTPSGGMDTLAGAPSVDPATLEDGVVFDESWDDALDTYWEGAGFPPAGSEAAAAAVPGSGEAAARAGGAGVTGADNVMMLASRLLDMDVTNADGESLGEISDFFVDVPTGSVLFATVKHGGFLEIGTQNLPVPLNALAWNLDEEKLMLPLRQEDLNSFPDIEEGWENTLDPGWIVVRAYWRDAGYGSPLLEQAVEPQRVLRASKLLDDYGFGTYPQPSLGEVQDLIVDLENSKVQYIVLSLADTGIFGQEWRIVPFAALDPAAAGGELAFPQSFNADLLRDAPRVAEGSLADLDTIHPGWDDEIAQFWSQAGYTVGR